MNWFKQLLGMETKTTKAMKRVENAWERIAEGSEALADAFEERFGLQAPKKGKQSIANGKDESSE